MDSLATIPQIGIKYERHHRVEKEHIRTAEEAYDIFMAVWDIDTIDYIENFYVLLLDRAHQVLGVAHISQGGTTNTIVDSKVVFGRAILTNASSIILAHNHPSGSLSISDADKNVTQKLKQAGELLDIVVLDHIIVTRNEYVSLADEELM